MNETVISFLISFLFCVYNIRPPSRIRKLYQLNKLFLFLLVLKVDIDPICFSSQRNEKSSAVLPMREASALVYKYLVYLYSNRYSSYF